MIWEELWKKQRKSEPFDEECLEAIACRRAWNKYEFDMRKMSEGDYIYVIGVLVFDLENRPRSDAWNLFDLTICRYMRDE